MEVSSSHRQDALPPRRAVQAIRPGRVCCALDPRQCRHWQPTPLRWVCPLLADLAGLRRVPSPQTACQQDEQHPDGAPCGPGSHTWAVCPRSSDPHPSHCTVFKLGPPVDCPLCNAPPCTATHEIYECPKIANEIENKFDPLLNLALNDVIREHKPNAPPTTLASLLPKPTTLNRVSPQDRHRFHRNLAAGCTPKELNRYLQRLQIDEESARKIEATLSDLLIQRSLYGYDLHYRLSSAALGKSTTQPLGAGEWGDIGP